MKDLAEISSQLAAQLVISEGSLLQLYRNCSLGESDMDFLLPLSWWNSTNSKQLRAALEEANFKNTIVFGELEHVGYEESWVRNGVKVDLFSSRCSTKTNLCFLNMWVGSRASVCSFPFESIRYQRDAC